MGIACTPTASRDEILELFELASERRVPIYVHIRNSGPVEPAWYPNGEVPYVNYTNSVRKSLQMFREIQPDRAEGERRDLYDAAALLESRGSPPIMASFFQKSI